MSRRASALRLWLWRADKAASELARAVLSPATSCKARSRLLRNASASSPPKRTCSAVSRAISARAAFELALGLVPLPA